MTTEEARSPDVVGVDWEWGGAFHDILMNRFEEVNRETMARAEQLTTGIRSKASDVDGAGARRYAANAAVNVSIDARQWYGRWAGLVPVAIRGLPCGFMDVLKALQGGVEYVVAWERDLRAGSDEAEEATDLYDVVQSRVLMDLVVRRQGVVRFLERSHDDDEAGRRLRTHLCAMNRHLLRTWGAAVSSAHALTESPLGEGVDAWHLAGVLGESYKFGVWLDALETGVAEGVVDVEWSLGLEDVDPGRRDEAEVGADWGRGEDGNRNP